MKARVPDFSNTSRHGFEDPARRPWTPMSALYWLLAIVAGAGFAASATCHLLGWLHLAPFGKKVFVLHIVCIGLVFVFVFLQRNDRASRKRTMKETFSNLPPWVSTALGALFAYAFLHFFFFMYCTSQYERHAVPLWLEIRGFSGHWMIFFAMETAMAANLVLGRRKLPPYLM